MTRAILSILVLISSLFTAVSAAPRVLLLHESFPGSSARFYSDLKSGIERAGFPVEEVSGTALAVRLDAETGPGSILVLPNSVYFPTDAKQSLGAFLKRRNHLFAISGPAMKQMVRNLNGRWLTRDELKASCADKGGIAIKEFAGDDTSIWERISGWPEQPLTYRVESTGDAKHPHALHVEIGKYRDYEMLSGKTLDHPFPDGSSVMLFRAKGGTNTSELMIDWHEKDGMRWLTAVKLTTEWKQYALTPEDFRPWNDRGLTNRGFDGDKFNPSNAESLTIGLVDGISHVKKGIAHSYWISDIRTAKDEYANVDFTPPIVESLSPFYKTYRTKASALRLVGDAVKTPIQAEVVCPVPRMRGLGSDAVRKWRFIPVLQVLNTDGAVTGSAAHLFLNTTTDYAGSVFGYLGLGQDVLGRDPKPNVELIVSMLRRAASGVFLANAGTEHFAYEVGEKAKLGAYAVNLSGGSVDGRIGFSILSGGKTVRGLGADVVVPAGTTRSPAFAGTDPIELSPGEYRVRTALSVGGKVVDTIEHPFNVIRYHKLTESEAVIQKGGDFRLNGKKWYPLGMNYWPRYVTGSEDGHDALFWLSPDDYDPEMVDEDLAIARKLKMNVLSIACYNPSQARPTMDFLERARRYGIKVHFYTDGLYPLSLNPDVAARTIKETHSFESPAIFAYDVGWEVHIGNYDVRHTYDKQWQDWVVDRYGSVEAAEKDWGFRPEVAGQVITGPKDDQLTTDGSWRIYVAAYRRFWDDELSRRYKAVREQIREFDQYHLIGSRSGWAGTGALGAVPGFPFDLASGAKHLDFTSPEGYAVGGDRNGFLLGGLNNAYGRLVSGGKPVVWVEYSPAVAVALSPLTYEGHTPEMMEQAAQYYHNMVRMTYETHASGSMGWWWPGGYRLGENSDLGVIDTDGTPRPTALEISKAADRFYSPREMPKPDYLLTIDRDRYVTGYAGIYQDFAKQYVKAFLAGKQVGLRTAGTGTTSANTPLVAVGNVPCNGSNPPKYLNAEFNWLRVNGKKMEDDAVVEVGSGQSVRIEASVGNIGEASWPMPGHASTGAVSLQAESEGGKVLGGISADTPFLGDAMAAMDLGPVPQATTYAFRMVAAGRTSFGEVLRVTVKPRP